MRPDADCVVVGAGFTGCALALGLADTGCDVILLEREPLPAASADSRGLALALSSQRLLASLGVWSAVAPYAYAIHHVHISHRGHFGALRLDRADLGVPALGYVCPAEHLHAALRTAVMAHPRIEVHWSHSVRTTAAEQSRIVLTVDAPSATHEYGTNLLIGADGNGSRVRELVGIVTNRHDYGQTAIVANVDVEAPAPHTAFERFTPTGPLALLPLGGHRHVVVRTALSRDAPALLALDDTAFLADVARRFGDRLGAFTRPGRRQAHALILQRAASLVAPRTVLVGNAANAIHPNAAQGLNLGLRDVAALLARIAAARARGDDPGSPAELAGYAASRRADQRATTQFTDFLARSFALQLPLVGALRSLALTLGDRTPPVKRLLLKRLTGLGGARP